MNAVAAEAQLRGYTRADLAELRLESLEILTIGQYLLALAYTVLPFQMYGERYWASVGGAILALVVFLVRERSQRVAGIIMASALGLAWAVGTLVAPSDILMLLSALVIAVSGILFGARGAFLAAGFTSSVVIAGTASGFVGINLVFIGSLASWAGAGLVWLASRPAYTTLDWAWVSYGEARDKHDELRRKHGELTRALHSLDLAYQSLELLNAELSRARQAAERARRLKSEFAASISHELRTPLNLILGFSEMFVRQPELTGSALLTSMARADLDAIYRNAEHLAGLIDDVLDLSQIEAGRLGLDRRKVSLAATVSEAIQTVAARYADLGLSLSTDLPMNLPLVIADQLRIRQILINLLNNAARFTDRGGVTVRIEERENELVVSVGDTGIGIAPEEIQHVFNEFFQTNSTLQRRVGGSGLGLAISKRIVELHGGAMWAESRIGEGSVFSFSIPIIANIAVEAYDRGQALWQHRAEALGPSSRLALVSTDESIIQVFQRYLDGYQIVPSPDLDGARALAKAATIDGVILAGSSSDECLHLLEGARQAGVSLPIAVCAIPGREQRANELGVIAYLDKPVLSEQLEQALAGLKKRPRHILIIDDNHDLVRLLSRMVAGMNRRYQVWQATGGREALLIMESMRPDVVILDLLMPEVNGYEVITSMRADERLRKVPIIIMSAQGVSDEMRNIGLVGFSRSGGFSVADSLRCLRSGFDALTLGVADHSGSKHLAALAESPV